MTAKAKEAIHTIEPKDYFDQLKLKVDKVTMDSLRRNIDSINAQLTKAHQLNQKSLLHRLAFTHQCILKEQTLVAAGFDRYVYRDDIQVMLDKIKPANSVKVIELDRYPRVIPDEPMKLIEKAMKLNIFDDMCVVFTDFTDEDYSTPKEKEFVQKNRDPVVFGHFHHKKAGLQHDRFYFLADWEDEYCDLTFGKMLEKMSEAGVKKPEHIIGQDADYINTLVKDALTDIDGEPKDTKKDNFFTRLMKKI